MIQFFAWVFVVLWGLLFYGERKTASHEHVLGSLLIAFCKTFVLSALLGIGLTVILVLLIAMFGGFSQ